MSKEYSIFGKTAYHPQENYFIPFMSQTKITGITLLQENVFLPTEHSLMMLKLLTIINVAHLLFTYFNSCYTYIGSWFCRASSFTILASIFRACFHAWLMVSFFFLVL